MDEMKFIEIENEIGKWVLPQTFVPKSLGGDNPNVSGVVGLTAVGKTHSNHILEAILFFSSLKSHILDKTGKNTGKKVTIVDAGAHIGTISVGVLQGLDHFSSRSSSTIFPTIYAVEMIPELFFCMSRNIENNCKATPGEVIASNVALTSHEIHNENKTVNVQALSNWDFSARPGTSGCSTYSVDNIDFDYHKVNTWTIDKLLNESQNTNNVVVIKVDCEGSDLKVLKGSTETINQHRPVILFESIDHEGTEFSVGKDMASHKPEKNQVYIRVKKLINKEYQDFFDKNGYRVFRNWLYNSWDEFIAIPKEDLENRITKTHLPFIDDQCEDDDMWAGPITFNECVTDGMVHFLGRDPTLEELLADYILCILHTFPEEIRQKWFEKNNINLKAATDYERLADSPLVKYAKELLKC